MEIFDRHRVGEHEFDWPEHDHGRCCLDSEEMAERGWRVDECGRWFDPALSSRAATAFRPSVEEVMEVAA